MKMTNITEVSSVRVFGDINLKQILHNHFYKNDAPAIFLSVKKIYHKLVDIHMSTNKEINFSIENLYFPEYVFEIHGDFYILAILTPFDQHQKIEIRKRVNNESIRL